MGMYSTFFFVELKMPRFGSQKKSETGAVQIETEGVKNIEISQDNNMAKFL